MSRAFRLGVFIVGGLVILCVGVFLIGNKRFMFGSTYKLTAEFDDASGLVNGADVRVGGIHEGTVSQIDLPQQPGGKVTVVMRMERATRNVVRTDSTATIRTEGLLGDKYVEVSYGSANAEAIANGDSIEGQNPPSLEEQATKATNEADKTMAQVGSAVSAFQDDAEALKHNFLLRGYFKKRGYYDESSLNAYQMARLPGQAPEKEFTYPMNRLFKAPNSARLTDQKALDEAGKFLKDHPSAVVVVSTSAAGTESKEQRAETEARARAVRDYLAQQFKLDDGKVKTYSANGSGGAGGPSGDNLRILVYGEQASSARPDENRSGG